MPVIWPEDICTMKMIGTILMVLIGFLFDSKVDIAKPDGIAQRKTVATLSNVKGTVYKAMDDVYTIECGEKHLRLNVINLPEEFRKDNAEITFSGNIKLSQPLEDDWGELFEVTSVR